MRALELWLSPLQVVFEKADLLQTDACGAMFQLRFRSQMCLHFETLSNDPWKSSYSLREQTDNRRKVVVGTWEFWIWSHWFLITGMMITIEDNYLLCGTLFIVFSGFLPPHYQWGSYGDRKTTTTLYSVADIHYYRTTGSHFSQQRGEPEHSGQRENRETQLGYAASVTVLWFKTLEGLTSHLERLIPLCISEYGRVCGRGLGLICGIALVVFFSASRITLCGYDQRYATGDARRQFLHSKSTGLLLYHCLSLWLWGFWVSVVYKWSFVLSVSDFVPWKAEELIHIFVPRQKDCKSLWRGLDLLSLRLRSLGKQLKTLMWVRPTLKGCCHLQGLQI